MARLFEDDLTIIYYTANVVPGAFANSVYTQLLRAAQGQKIIVVSQKPMLVEETQVQVDFHRSHLNIYRQALIGAKLADTEYIALAEDDVLYTPEHFKRRPSPGKFAYNLATWNIFTWGEPLFHHKDGGRINLNGLICERELFIEAMEERFTRWPDDSKIKLGLWAEPGRYEGHLDVTIREVETFYTYPPNIIFSHQTALSYDNLGEKKRMGQLRTDSLPYWGRATEVVSLYNGSINEEN